MSASQASWRILVIDDNPDIHRDIEKCLVGPSPKGALQELEREMFGVVSSSTTTPTYEIVSAHQGEQGVVLCGKAVDEDRRFSAAFVDMRMPPGIDGLETIERLWRLDPGLQVILCTAFSDYSWKQITSRLGRRDDLLVLRKPFEQVEVQQMAMAMCEKRRLTDEARTRMHELERIVGERTAELQEARRQDRMRLDSLEEIVDRRTQELRKAALHDRLTGLPNRGMFAEAVNRAIARASIEPGYGYAVLFLDCDRFKVVNDSLGHACGDLLLTELARRLGEACERNADVRAACEHALPARLGGDEFAVLLAGVVSGDNVLRSAAAISKMLEAPARFQGHDLRLNASIGIATSAQRYSRAEDAIRDADTAMYKAKAAGRGRVVAFTPEMHDDAMQRLVLENDLRSAISAGSMHVHYQPIVDLTSGEVVALEALSRWNHPSLGPIPPTRYIPLAEETGLILPLGEQVLRTSFQQLAQWSRNMPNTRVPVLSANVSRKQLVEAGFADRLSEIVADTGVDPRRVVLEITESTVMEDMDAALSALERVRSLGMGVYMDDFGTGHSSLACLQMFPLTGLKIDRSFTSGVKKEPYRTSLVQAIVTVARNMRIPAIAEGVETVEDVAWLQTLGCERGQGFFFARGLPPEDVGELLAAPGSWLSFEGVREVFSRSLTIEPVGAHS